MHTLCLNRTKLWVRSSVRWNKSTRAGMTIHGMKRNTSTPIADTWQVVENENENETSYSDILLQEKQKVFLHVRAAIYVLA